MERKKELIIKLEQVDVLIDFLRKKRATKTFSPDDVEKVLKDIEERVLSLCREAEELERSTITSLAQRRAIVLLITSIIEICVAFAIAPFAETIAKYAALYAFSPLVSAVSGNYGLQTAAIVIRGLAVGSLKDKTRAVLREVITGLLCGVIVGLFAATIAYITTKRPEAFIVLPLSLLAGMCTAGFMGALFPQIAKLLGFDPAIVAGPAETAFQDLASYVTFLFLLSLFY